MFYTPIHYFYKYCWLLHTNIKWNTITTHTGWLIECQLDCIEKQNQITVLLCTDPVTTTPECHMTTSPWSRPWWELSRACPVRRAVWWSRRSSQVAAVRPTHQFLRGSHSGGRPSDQSRSGAGTYAPPRSPSDTCVSTKDAHNVRSTLGNQHVEHSAQCYRQWGWAVHVKAWSSNWSNM